MNTQGVNCHCHDRQASLLTLSLEEYRDYKAVVEGQRLVVGIHPWDTTEAEMYGTIGILSDAVTDSRVVAIGEVGIDPLHGATLQRQEQLLRYQLRLANEARMPVMFHIVRRYDILMRLYKEYRPVASWAVHGFRSNADVARQLTAAGIYLSIGMRYNAEAVRAIPDHLLLLETDELPEAEISAVVESVAATRDVRPSAVAQMARDNLNRFLRSGQKSA